MGQDLNYRNPLFHNDTERHRKRGTLTAVEKPAPRPRKTGMESWG